MRILVLPVKSLSKAKRRLSGLLSPMERGALTLAMLEDALDAALAVAGWETWVISPDETVLEVAARRGARPVAEEKPPLAAAIRQVEADSIEREADALAVLLADTALVTHEALVESLHTLGPVVLAPSSSDGGTNLLVRRPPRSIRARFGPGSFDKHVEAAAERALPVSMADREELAFDLDGPDDILTVLRAGREGRTLDVCRAMDLGSRLRVRA